jgi:Predicted glycosyltransferases
MTNASSKVKKVAICIPVRKLTYTPFLVSLINRIQELASMYNVNVIFDSTVPLPKARTILVKEALEKNVDKIIFIDSDMVIGEKILPTMIESDEDICSALYFSTDFRKPVVRIMDPEKKQFRIPDEKELPNLKYVDAVGLGCAVIDASVFKKLEEPWFWDDWYNTGMSEDVFFCMKAQTRGYKIRLFPDLVVGHLGGMTI